MTFKKLLTSIAGVIAILGAIVPWYKISLFGQTASMNAFQMSALYIVLAILAIICGAALIVLSLVKEKQIKKTIKIKDLSKVNLCTGAVLIVIAVIAFIAINSDFQGFGSASWGVYLIGLSGIATIVLHCLKNVAQLDKVVININGEGEKKSADKSEKAEKTTKK